MKNIIIFLIIAVMSLPAASRLERKAVLPPAYIDGANIAWASTTTITIGTTGEVSKVKDSQDRIDMIFTNTITVNCQTQVTNGFHTNSGLLNGLGLGITFTSNTLYYVYLCGRRGKPYSNTFYGLVTTNATAPEFPTNSAGNEVLDSYRKIGSYLTYSTNGTGNVMVIPFVANGKGRTRDVSLSYPPLLLGNSAALAGTNITFSSASLITRVPDTAGEVTFHANFTGATNTDIAYLASSDIIGTTSALQIGTERTGTATGGAPNILPISVAIKGQAVSHRVTVAPNALLLYVIGWKENL